MTHLVVRELVGSPRRLVDELDIHRHGRLPAQKCASGGRAGTFITKGTRSIRHQSPGQRLHKQGCGTEEIERADLAAASRRGCAARRSKYSAEGPTRPSLNIARIGAWGHTQANSQAMLRTCGHCEVQEERRGLGGLVRGDHASGGRRLEHQPATIHDLSHVLAVAARLGRAGVEFAFGLCNCICHLSFDLAQQERRWAMQQVLSLTRSYT